MYWVTLVRRARVVSELEYYNPSTFYPDKSSLLGQTPGNIVKEGEANFLGKIVCVYVEV